MREADRCLAGSGDRQRFLELYYTRPVQSIKSMIDDNR